MRVFALPLVLLLNEVDSVIRRVHHGRDVHAKVEVVGEELRLKIVNVKVEYTVRIRLIGDLGNLKDVPSLTLAVRGGVAPSTPPHPAVHG